MKIKLGLAALAAALSLTACSSAGTTGRTASSATATTATATTGTGGAPAGAKVSANTADESQIAAALTAAGVGNAERWAREVVEYRPYAADDADLTSLRQNLAKYNPGEDTVNKIVSALTP
ncbi:hypothetical protein MTP10_41430 [Nonomuraea sp. 3-1Str]|uniref:hypothetical protein n=1 Tax=Nonomuraea sp. 3-1Str TaxID=2929801 RepID=UPI002865A839|nr:hypothetical protein [Nonomuraea sp. 3-1Str]MDR8415183.1 hypothetical protein [Nonomuraea sp. 3-1Str]